MLIHNTLNLCIDLQEIAGSGSLFLTLGNTGNLVITGNLTVNGSAINTNTISANTIKLNNSGNTISLVAPTLSSANN